jgi:hypothetical protein
MKSPERSPERSPDKTSVIALVFACLSILLGIGAYIFAKFGGTTDSSGKGAPGPAGPAGPVGPSNIIETFTMIPQFFADDNITITPFNPDAQNTWVFQRSGDNIVMSGLIKIRQIRPGTADMEIKFPDSIFEGKTLSEYAWTTYSGFNQDTTGIQIRTSSGSGELYNLFSGGNLNIVWTLPDGDQSLSLMVVGKLVDIKKYEPEVVG